MKKTIVVTGSTRGIGFGLATAFLGAGHNVVVCGRTAASTNEAAASLAGEATGGRVLGVPADVSDREQVERLWNAAAEEFGRIHIWINNAGLGTRSAPFWNRSQEEFSHVVSTNLLGTMNGSAVAVKGMLDQGGGFVYNMEGLGSRGPILAGSAVYAATKAGVTRFTQGLIKDTADTPVHVGFVSPGMVLTELLTGPDPDSVPIATKRAFNILADRVDTVAAYLSRRILLNTRHGARIDWLPGWKIGWRFATAAFRRNRLITID
jgi:NAD(P)-dependent dehydrogenase (short-subunit alcohol dehydrogenase family)